MIALFTASRALAATTPIDVVTASQLGMPRLHDPFSDCQCVGMTWDDGGETLTLEVPVADIVGLERVVVEGGHDVSLVLVSGERLLLEQAPCVFAEQMSQKYATVLALQTTVVGAEGEQVDATCGDVLEGVRQWSAEVQRQQREAVHYLSTEDIPLASLQVLSSKGEEGAVTGARRALAAARTRAASCWTGDASAASESVQLTVKGSGGARPKVKAKAVGVAALDRCFDEIASAVSIPAGKIKIKAVYGPPVPHG